MMRRWRVFGVDDEKATQLHEAFRRFLTTRNADGFGIDMPRDGLRTAGDVASALRAIDDAPAPFDCLVIDINLNRHHDPGGHLPPWLSTFNRPYGNWIGRFVIEKGLPTEILYYSERERDLLEGFDLPSMGVRFMPGNEWEMLCGRVLDVLEQRQRFLLNGSVEGRARLSEFLATIDQVDPQDADAVRGFLTATFELTNGEGRTETWRRGDFFLRTALALTGRLPKTSPREAIERLRAMLSDLQVTDPAAFSNATDIETCGELIARSRTMKNVFSMIRQVASSDASVLITGETGTGKEKAAQEIHRRSRRVRGRFVTVNCSAIQDTLIESELFGHERGAFTGATDRKIGKFELADKGTIFLDEIGEMSLAAQAKVLRVLQEREVERVGSTQTQKIDVRIIAATNRDLRRGVAEKWFREDLFHRLCVVRIKIPSLSERPEDVAPIALSIAREFAKKMAKVDPRTGAALELSPQALERLRQMEWTGNVRELRNVIEGAFVLTPEGEPLDVGLDRQLAQRAGGTEDDSESGRDAGGIWAQVKEGRPEKRTLGALEKHYGRPLTLKVAQLALAESTMADAAAAFTMSYRDFQQWLRRRGYVKGAPRGRYLEGQST
jgi:transcriptional regulator with GAF, ATPase, and Fis domain